MESRIPKPRFLMRRSLSASDVKLASKPTIANVDQACKISQKPSSNRDISTLPSISKAKSTHNIMTAQSKEIISVSKLMPTRSKTQAILTRGQNDVKTAAKRPGLVNLSHENKRPHLKPVPKSTTTTGVSRQNLAISSASVTSKATTVSTTTGKQRAKKWDLKGRLEEATEELNTSRDQLRFFTERNEQLLSQVTVLSKTEEMHRSNANKLEVLCHELRVTNTELLARRTSLEVKKGEMAEELQNLEQLYKEGQKNLEMYQAKRTEQIAELRQCEMELNALRGKNKTLVDEINRLDELNQELQDNVHSLDKNKRLLHNTIQDLKGNIRVFCRVRPKIEKEKSKVSCSMNYQDEFTIEIARHELLEASTCGGRPRGTQQEFTFDRVFPPNASQSVVFEEISLLVQSALEGYNVCVFAYGQTGSGKTYTMEGSPGPELEGMIPRTVRHIFQEKKRFETLGWEYRIETSFLEIYNEHIVDLLDANPKTHEIRMVDSKGSEIYVTNLRIEEVHEPQELENWLRVAQRNRAVAATYYNERSSRSHSIARIHLLGTHKKQNETCSGMLNLVDLAGSERLRNDETARTTETKNINKSLANLGNVILALLKKQDHVPYRNSKLTHLLMPSLGGNSKTLMLLNVSPLDECFNETLNSLRFGSSVRHCKTGSVKRTRGILSNNSNIRME